MISITDLAKEKIEEILKVNPGKYLRIVMAGVGWGGPQLGLALDEPIANELPVKINGLDVLIADNLKTHTEGNTLDYIKAADGEGFTISKGSSDCGGCTSC